MCKYCENRGANDNLIHNEIALGEADVEYKTYIHRWLPYILTDLWIGDYSIFSDCLKINYCPMCGRKLGDISNDS